MAAARVRRRDEPYGSLVSRPPPACMVRGISGPLQRRTMAAKWRTTIGRVPALAVGLATTAPVEPACRDGLRSSRHPRRRHRRHSGDRCDRLGRAAPPRQRDEHPRAEPVVRQQHDAGRRADRRSCARRRAAEPPRLELRLLDRSFVVGQFAEWIRLEQQRLVDGAMGMRHRRGQRTLPGLNAPGRPRVRRHRVQP